ncbi:MAG: tRNA (5-methylaminomethyl-2-thiouridine)(34)-methyltransferase MnmD [bacterium]|nr:tRNA (5-methylaminomethyl-2-thiouridine)(34)-methyltransferase MnmD [bacterium]
MTEIKIIQTEDGSHSLYRPDLNETYHSFHGAQQESAYVFIKMGLDHFISSNPDQNNLKIFEVGFGTGLNALLTLASVNGTEKHVQFDSIETIPLDTEITENLNYTENIGYKGEFQKMHLTPWEELSEINKSFSLTKINSKLEEFQSELKYDIIYFDAFAPSKQPELWSLEIMEKCFRLLAAGGVLVTYCAKGQLKRDLKTVGFEVETLPGAPGKKEMVRGTKPKS